MFWRFWAIWSGEIVLRDNLRVVFLQLHELLLELVVAKKGVVVVRRIVDDAESELGGGGANAQS